MSETANHVPVPDDPDEIFETVILGNRDVCQECFNRLGHREDVPTKHGLEHGDRAAYIDHHETEDGAPLDREYFEHVRDQDRVDDAADEAPTDGTTDACSVCGTTDTGTPPSMPRSAEAVVEHAMHLSATLSAFGIDHDPEVLLDRVEAGKHDPELTSDETTLFSLAVAAAVDAVG